MGHPLHRSHTGRDECDAVKVGITASSDQLCNICNRGVSLKPGFRCLPCNFALCCECSKGSIHPAHVGHALYLINPHNELFWTCGGCNKTSEQIGENSRYFCEECDFSLCKACFQPIKRPLHHHWLPRTDVRYTYHLSKGDWRCDSCGENNGVRNYFPRHCSSCQFDVCDTCCQGWRTTLHHHLLYKADSMLVYQQYYGGWRCDNCNRRFRPDINKNPYHCPECSYDVCERCLRLPEFQVVVRPAEILEQSNTPSAVLQRQFNPRIISRTAAGNPVTTPVDDVEEQVTTPSSVLSTDLCVVCMSNAKDATIVHGETGHVCCCFACAQELKRRNALCPICRAPIQSIIKQFTS